MFLWHGHNAGAQASHTRERAMAWEPPLRAAHLHRQRAQACERGDGAQVEPGAGGDVQQLQAGQRGRQPGRQGLQQGVAAQLQAAESAQVPPRVGDAVNAKDEHAMALRRRQRQLCQLLDAGQVGARMGD